MKRVLIATILILFSLQTILASAFVGTVLTNVISIGFDLATTKRVTKFDIDGEKINIGGISIKGLKKSISSYDFSSVGFGDRYSLYEKAKAPITWPMISNVLLGYGKGSKSQGDLGGELFGLISDWTSLGIIATGIILYTVDIFITGGLVAMFGGEYQFNDPNNELQQTARGLLAGGFITLGATRLAQLFIPLSYGLRYNKVLRSSLGVTKDKSDAFGLSLSVVPAIVINDNSQVGLNLVAKLTF